MKFHTYILFLCLTSLSTTLIAQDAKNEKFTSTVFKVFGACEECKDRIELAIKVRGVRLGIWNVETKMLILEYDSTIISLEKIQNKIVNKKAIHSSLGAEFFIDNYKYMEGNEKRSFTLQRLVKNTKYS